MVEIDVKAITALTNQKYLKENIELTQLANKTDSFNIFTDSLVDGLDPRRKVLGLHFSFLIAYHQTVVEQYNSDDFDKIFKSSLMIFSIFNALVIFLNEQLKNGTQDLSSIYNLYSQINLANKNDYNLPELIDETEDVSEMYKAINLTIKSLKMGYNFLSSELLKILVHLQYNEYKKQ